MKLTFTIPLFICLLGIVSASAQSDPFVDSFYEPDLVISHKKEIALTDIQESKISSIYSTNSKLFSEKRKQWALAMSDFQSAVSEQQVDYQLLDAKFSKVLSIESEIKKIKLVSLAQIKNELTPEQQAKLDKIKEKNPGYNRAFELTMGSDDDGSKITIRETNTVPKGDPLFIIVGDKERAMQGKSSNFKDIDPNDIVAITVVKGAAAIEEYGEAGKHGVITIKLKPGAQRKYFKDN